VKPLEILRESLRPALVLAILVLCAAIARDTCGEDRLDRTKPCAVSPDKPLIIGVGAQWCLACRQLEPRYGAQLRAQGAYRHYDWDHDRSLLERHDPPLPPISTLPSIIVYQHDDRGRYLPPRLYVGLAGVELYLHGK
jgi:hypothetical protein